MKKKECVLLLTVVLLASTSVHQVIAMPDLSGLIEAASETVAGVSATAESAKEAVTSAAGDAGEVISGAASQAGETISNVAGQAGEALTNAAGQTGELILNTAEQAGELASGAAKKIGDTAVVAITQVQDISSGFASKAEDVISVWAENAGNTADNIKKMASEAGVTIQENATDLGTLTMEEVSKLTKTAGGFADKTISTVSSASDLVIDQAGHVINLAAVGMGQVTKSAEEAVEVLKQHGATLVEIANEAVAEIDLDDENNWEIAREKVDYAIEKAVNAGVIGRKLDMDTVHCVTRIVFGAMMYGHQYSSGRITLGKFATSMSEVLIREGLPTGVGFVVNRLFPEASGMAKDAVYYFIAVAYGDKSGDEIQQEEEALLKVGNEEMADLVVNQGK
ncbi:MAG: hypothetical protein IJX90_03980 [Blautia sp.]|nr:hypothetical protein [Blautia sp.]